MKYIKMRTYFKAIMIVATLVLIWGCGSGGSTSNEIASNVASVSISSSSSSEYVVSGNNMDGVAGISLTINYDYDSSFVPSPLVTQGGLISGALMVVNTGNPGTIKIAIASVKAFSGNGQIATISFTGSPGTGNVSITSINMFDINGAPIP